MSKKISVLAVMDPIEDINPRKDSTLAMLLAAQARGWQIGCAQLDDIWLRDGEATGRVAELTVRDDMSNWFEAGQSRQVALSEVDVILMRKDPPFNMQYIYATYILERAAEQGALVVNRPQSLRDANEKVFTAWFPQCCPPTMISRSLTDLTAFVEDGEQTVIKPLDRMGGKSVFVTRADDGNHNVILETLTHDGNRYVIAQRYVPEITTTGDKRILLIDGEPIPYALARVPTGADHRGNLAVGARSEARPLTDRDSWICQQVGPVLKEKGILFAGIDVIGDFLTEINVTSPTCIRELDQAFDLDIAGQLMDVIASRIVR